MKELILGGMRSGKSALAHRRAAERGREVVYVATARAGDEEMARRIARHRNDRPGHWTLVEEPVALAGALERWAGESRCLLVDCLTLWLSNLLAGVAAGAGEAALARERDALIAVVPGLPGDLILVSNEVGQGVVPAEPLARRFCDEAGRLHQALAERCDRVSRVTAGLAQVLKGPGP